MSAEGTEQSDNTDLVWGGAAIAKVIGRTERVTFGLLEKHQLPAKKVGGRWVASHRKLIEYLIN
jgi:hypothetical protein